MIKKKRFEPRENSCMIREREKVLYGGKKLSIIVYVRGAEVVGTRIGVGGRGRM